jgi:hypothetical protein
MFATDMRGAHSWWDSLTCEKPRSGSRQTWRHATLSLSLLSSLLCGTSSLSYVDLYREPKTTHTSKWRQLPCNGLSEPKRDSPGPSRFLHSWWNGGAPPSANLGLGMGPAHSTPLSHSSAQMGRRDHRCHCPAPGIVEEAGDGGGATQRATTFPYTTLLLLLLLHTLPPQLLRMLLEDV